MLQIIYPEEQGEAFIEPWRKTVCVVVSICISEQLCSSHCTSRPCQSVIVHHELISKDLLFLRQNPLVLVLGQESDKHLSHLYLYCYCAQSPATFLHWKHYKQFVVISFSLGLLKYAKKWWFDIFFNIESCLFPLYFLFSHSLHICTKLFFYVHTCLQIWDFFQGYS